MKGEGPRCLGLISRKSTSTGGGVIKFCQKFKITVVRHLELYFGSAGPPTKCAWWQEACVQILCRSSLAYFKYIFNRFFFTNFVKNAHWGPRYLRFGGFGVNITFHHRDPKRRFLGGKHVLRAIARRNRTSDMARTRCEQYTDKNKGYNKK